MLSSSHAVPTFSQAFTGAGPSKDLRESYETSPTHRPKWHRHHKTQEDQELRIPAGLPDACDLAFRHQDRLLHRGALDAAQCHKAFGQVVLRLFPQGVAVASQGALLDRIFSESDQDLDGLLLFHEFQAFVLRGLQPLLRGHTKQSASLQAALPRALDYHAKTLQSHLAPQVAPAAQAQAAPPGTAGTGVALSGAFAPALSGLKDLGASSRVMAFAPLGAGGLARELTHMLQEYEIPEVSENLGSGAFGTVLKVKHYGTGEMRACKAVRLDQGSEQLKELVELEVTMLKSLDHVNLLRLHEAFRDGQRCVYLITELCAGGSLVERLEGQRRTRRPFFEGQSAAYAEQILSAASYCHQRGVLHRDLKPENVLFLTPAADSPVKVIDFGLSDTLERLRQNATEELQDRRGALGAVARLLPKLPGGLEILATKVTKEVMQRAGTPHYMAPEVYEGQYGEKADVWSIGVMIFEMLTNRHPFYTVGNDLDAVRRRILSPKGADFEADAAWRQVTPAALRACQAALRPQVASRPSAKELLNDTWFETVPRLALGVSGYSSGGSLKTSSGLQPQQVIEAMRRFAFPGYIGSTRIRLRQAFLRLLVYELPEAVLAPLRGAFLRLDRDSDGLLSAADLDGAVAGPAPTTTSFLDALFGEASKPKDDEEIRSLLAVSGGANGLGFSDFVAVMMPFCVSLQEPQCRLAFQRLAGHGTAGTLSRQVLVDTVQVGPDVPQAEVEAFRAGLPEELTFADFLELVRT